MHKSITFTGLRVGERPTIRIEHGERALTRVLADMSPGEQILLEFVLGVIIDGTAAERR